ncbi:MAG: DUF721 domain-containing protein [candidate division Zixibacteria bacterium]
MEQKPDRLGNIVDNLMASLGLKKSFHGWQVVEKWPDIVGKDIAKISRAIRFQDGILTVIVEQDAWRQELEMQREEILIKIRRRRGGKAVDKIFLKAGSIREN